MDALDTRPRGDRASAVENVSEEDGLGWKERGKSEVKKMAIDITYLSFESFLGFTGIGYRVLYSDFSQNALRAGWEIGDATDESRVCSLKNADPRNERSWIVCREGGDGRPEEKCLQFAYGTECFDNWTSGPAGNFMRACLLSPHEHAEKATLSPATNSCLQYPHPSSRRRQDLWTMGKGDAGRA